MEKTLNLQGFLPLNMIGTHLRRTKERIMQHQQISAPQQLAPEERAFFLRLAALNAAFEAAKAGPAGREMAAPAVSIDGILDRYFLALTDNSP